MLFTLLYVPCVATLAVIKRETQSWRWTAFAGSYAVVVAWIAATAFYQIGRLFTG
jgi:ferrous iron transport protein B